MDERNKCCKKLETEIASLRDLLAQYVVVSQKWHDLVEHQARQLDEIIRGNPGEKKVQTRKCVIRTWTECDGPVQVSETRVSSLREAALAAERTLHGTKGVKMVHFHVPDHPSARARDGFTFYKSEKDAE